MKKNIEYGIKSNNYDKLFSFEYLLRAYQISRRGKRGKRDVIKFENNLSLQLVKMYKELLNKKYRISNYKRFTIYEPKKREIQALSFKDRVILHAICDNFVTPEFEKRLIYDNCACRKNKGAHFGLNRLTYFLRSFYNVSDFKNTQKGYILKCDITKYFQSINHEVLKEMLGWIEDEHIKNFLFSLIDSYEHTPNTGLPMGNQTSQWFALLYLNPLDRLVKEKFKIKYYVRYMDDIIIIDENKEKLKNILVEMTKLVEDKLKLTFNKKTQIFSLKQGCEFLGFKFFLTKTGKVVRRVKKQTKIRLRNRVKFYVKQYNNGMLEYSDFAEPLKCVFAHLKHGNSYGLIKNMKKKLVLLAGNKHENTGCFQKEFKY
ncbi:MAG: RNA-directed DNA polymerase, partial [Clostridia bacterium]|nr:RNA-directed DNA polymerase [Clostridia bacterium]